MRIIPVLDLKGGVVVRGIGGRRDEYRPVVSRLTLSCRPADVAQAFRDHFGLSELYLADLDAIAGGPPALTTLGQLRDLGFRLWVDAGVREAAAVAPLTTVETYRVVLGLETLNGPADLARACDRFGDRIVFSLDLKGGAPLGDVASWGGTDPRTIAARAVSAGARRILVLDLAQVGRGAGTGTEELCALLAQEHPDVELAAGGGVRGLDDLRRLQACGVGAALVASSLHDGRLRREDLARL